MSNNLSYVKKRDQSRITIQTPSKELSFIENEDINNIHLKKDKILKKDEKNINIKEIKEETEVEDISLNKIRNKQCLSTYIIDNQKNFSLNKDIKNNKINKNKTTKFKKQ